MLSSSMRIGILRYLCVKLRHAPLTVSRIKDTERKIKCLCEFIFLIIAIIMDKATFLDVDDSIRMKNLLLPDENRDALNQQMDELMKKFDTKPSILVQPIPGICIKAKTTSGEKMFINVCVTDAIPPPEDISDIKLYEFINEKPEESDYTIPISIGVERMEEDKAGILCATFDVMINSAYLKKCQKKKHFMTFTILVILSGVADKFGKTLDMENYVILKNRTVMGKLQQHRIEKREPRKLGNQSLIQEISHSTKSADNKMHPQDVRKRDYTILRKPLKGPVEHLIVLFNMPKSVSVEDIVVLINSDRINVTDEKASTTYDVLLPYKLNTNNAKAFLDRNISVLRVDISIQEK